MLQEKQTREDGVKSYVLECLGQGSATTHPVLLFTVYSFFLFIREKRGNCYILSGVAAKANPYLHHGGQEGVNKGYITNNSGY